MEIRELEHNGIAFQAKHHVIEFDKLLKQALHKMHDDRVDRLVQLTQNGERQDITNIQAYSAWINKENV